MLRCAVLGQCRVRCCVDAGMFCGGAGAVRGAVLSAGRAAGWCTRGRPRARRCTRPSAPSRCAPAAAWACRPISSAWRAPESSPCGRACWWTAPTAPPSWPRRSRQVSGGPGALGGAAGPLAHLCPVPIPSLHVEGTGLHPDCPHRQGLHHLHQRARAQQDHPAPAAL